MNRNILMIGTAIKTFDFIEEARKQLTEECFMKETKIFQKNNFFKNEKEFFHTSE